MREHAGDEGESMLVMIQDFGILGGEWGRHGSPWADTLGKQSHGLQEGF